MLDLYRAQDELDALLHYSDVVITSETDGWTFEKDMTILEEGRVAINSRRKHSEFTELSKIASGFDGDTI